MKAIAAKLLAAQKAVQPAPKDGRNDFHKYDYATEKAILETAKRALHDAGLAVVSSLSSVDTGEASGTRWARVLMAYTILDPDSGETLDSAMAGYAEDKADKALYKAITGANKYFYLKFLGIPTDDDAEKEDEKPKAKQQPAKQPSKPAPLPAVSPLQKRIKDLMGQHGLSKEQVSNITGLQTTQGQPDDVLNAALSKLEQHVTAMAFQGKVIA